MWELLEGGEEFRRERLSRHKQKYVIHLPLPIQLGVFPCPLEGVGFDIDDQRNAEIGKSSGPHFEPTMLLDGKVQLPTRVSHRKQVAIVAEIPVSSILCVPSGLA